MKQRIKLAPLEAPVMASGVGDKPLVAILICIIMLL